MDPINEQQNLLVFFIANDKTKVSLLSPSLSLFAHRLYVKLKTIVLSHLTICDLFIHYSFSSV